MRCWAKDGRVLNEYDAMQVAACYRASYGKTRFLELMRSSAARRVRDTRIALVFLRAPYRGRMEGT
jgi:hypothetical protein